MGWLIYNRSPNAREVHICSLLEQAGFGLGRVLPRFVDQRASILDSKKPS